MRPFVRLLAVVFALACALAVGLTACGGDDDDDDATTDGDDDDSDVDAVTSASPERESSILAETHAGWKNPACYSCHDEAHLGGFALGECVTCHGANGAPRRATGHANAGCADCHADSHADLGFASPARCTACHKYDPAAECPVTESYDVVVIGAGGGGLAAATKLARAGLSVALVEKNYRVGGYMNRFKRGDYEFEISLHGMGGLDPNAVAHSTLDSFTDLGIADRVEPLRCEPVMYRSIFPGLTVDVPSDVDAYRAMLKEMYPAEADGIDALFDEMAIVDQILRTILQMTDDFDLQTLLQLLQDIPGALDRIRYLNESLAEAVGEFVTDPELAGIFEQLVTYVGGGPSELQALFFMAMWSSYHDGGFYYLTGGSGAVSNALADVFVENGGVLKLNTLAEKIVVEDGLAVQVQTEDDACLDARYVVSNASAPATLLEMIGAEYLPDDYVADVNAMEIGVATFQVFLGVDAEYPEVFDGIHEIMVNTAFDQDENFAYVNGGMPEAAPFIIADYTETDPTTAPAGKSSIALTTYLPYDLENTWNWSLDYSQYTEFKNEIAEIFIERAEAYLPGLSEHIEVMEVGSPVTNYAFSLNPAGTIFGWSNTPGQGTILRLEQQTPIDNVLLAGAWTFPGGGQSSVISSGIGAAEAILDKEAARK